MDFKGLLAEEKGNSAFRLSKETKGQGCHLPGCVLVWLPVEAYCFKVLGFGPQ